MGLPSAAGGLANSRQLIRALLPLPPLRDSADVPLHAGDMAIICLTGTPGSGKTTVGEAIASGAAAGAHVQVDFFRKMVRAGYASPHHWDDEVARQYDLARRAAAATALLYAGAGFTVVIDDIIPMEVVEDWRALLAGEEPVFVLLDPPLDVALERNDLRAVWTVDPEVVRDLHKSLGRARGRPDWVVVDNQYRSPEEVADQVLETTA